MNSGNPSLIHECPICGAARQEECELNSGGIRFEPHPERLRAERTLPFPRKSATAPTTAIDLIEIAFSAPQKVEKNRIAVVISLE